MSEHPTAYIIIIGDEILSGKTMDTNSHFLCQELYSCGVKVLGVSVIPDNVDIIAGEISKWSSKANHVFCTGGIGPTHDDMTYEGLANAFQEELVLKKELVEIHSLLCLGMKNADNAVVKMSTVPKAACLHHISKENGFLIEPLVSVRNVFVFPGIPSYLHTMFKHVKSKFTSNQKFHCKALYINVDEIEIIECLNKAVKRYKNQVEFGSYPDVKSLMFQAKITAEANCPEILEEALGYLRSILPSNIIVSPTLPKSEESMNAFHSILENETCKSLALNLIASIDLVEKALANYPIDKMCLSFNGGKDCTVLLHLITCILEKRKIYCELKAFFVCSNKTFPEITEFVHRSASRYNLKLLTYKYPMKEALIKLQNDHPEIEAIFIGVRNTDPRSAKLLPMQKTDSDWPQFMRISPILSWSFADVWQFLQRLEIPYCSLYDRGYTSLGCISNTVQTSSLKVVTDDEIIYLPAYMLKDPNSEREGRLHKF